MPIETFTVYPNPAAYNAATGRNEDWRCSDNSDVSFSSFHGQLTIQIDPPDQGITIAVRQDIRQKGDPYALGDVGHGWSGVVGGPDSSFSGKLYIGNVRNATAPFTVHFT